MAKNNSGKLEAPTFETVVQEDPNAVRLAIVADDVVTNVIHASPGFMGGIECGPEVAIGWSYNGRDFIGPSPAPDPVASSSPADNPLWRWEFKAMVAFLGLGEAITAAIQAMPDPLQRAVATARYNESDLYRRDDPLFGVLAPAVGLTPEQIDEAWMTMINHRRSQK